MKRAFTLVEIIVTIVILGVLSAGTFVSLKHLYLRSAKSKALSDLSFTSQIVIDQIAALLYERVPATVIGSKTDGSFLPISNIYGGDYKILQWIGTSVEAYKSRAYSGFIDLDGSNKNTKTVVSYDFNASLIDALHVDKFGSGSIANQDIALIFAGSFDDASLVASDDFNSSFGWANNGANLTYTFTATNNNITFITQPKEIYEKYYLVDSAYAIARGVDVNTSLDPNSLYLFYNFRPWKNQKFTDGNYAKLAEDVISFQAGVMNNNLYFNFSTKKNIRGGNSVNISKEKVVF
ncbi:MAG: type II secretion system protein [Sulfurospirillum sp.]|nr:type II secretion system protein [Sulfurospirillum sp.]